MSIALIACCNHGMNGGLDVMTQKTSPIEAYPAAAPETLRIHCYRLVLEVFAWFWLTAEPRKICCKLCLSAA